jgi:Putative zinc-finger
MQHGEAIRSMASEKYLLNELTPELREEFEEHFFGCPDCALEVRAGAAFLEHSKIVLATPVPKETPAPAGLGQSHGWRGWLRPSVVVPVLAILLVVIGYQNFATLSRPRATAELRTPQILPSVSLVSARGGSVPAINVSPDKSFLLYVDVPTDSRFTSYVCELHDATGALEWSVPVSTEAAKNTLPLHVPADSINPGAYALVVRGITGSGSGSVLASYPFELQASR